MGCVVHGQDYVLARGTRCREPSVCGTVVSLMPCPAWVRSFPLQEAGPQEFGSGLRNSGNSIHTSR